MAGTVSSLGALASGTSALNADLVDKLKSAEKSAVISPINSSISKIKTQQSDLSSLIVTLSSLKSAAMDLSSDTTYLKRSATSTDTAIGISVSNGVQTQDIAMTVSQLAQNHVIQSGGFAASTSTVALTNTTLKLEANGSTYNIDVAAGTTLEQLAQKINDATKGAILASTLNTGVGSNPYVMVLKSKDTGAASTIKVTEGAGLNTGLVPTFTANSPVPDNSATSTDIAAGDIKINGVNIGAISISGKNADDSATAIKDAINLKTTDTGVSAEIDGNGKLVLKNSSGGKIELVTSNGAYSKTGLLSSDGTNTTAATALQVAQDAKFTFNGINMQRSTNSITDIITGATISLNKVTSSNVNLSIKQDTSGIPDLVNTFVSAFNSASSKIKDLTAYNSDTKQSGSLQGLSDVTSLYSTFASIITSRSKNGASLMDYGFSLDKTGMLSVDTTTLNSKLSENPSALEALFRGSSTVTNAKYTALMSATTTDTVGGFGDIVINGVSIAGVNTLSTNTAEQNAQLFVTQINKQTDSTGVKAYTDGNGKLILESLTDGKIEVQTNANGALASGLSSSSNTSAPMNKLMVAVGSTKTEDGIFTQLNKRLASVVTDTNSSLKLFSNSLQSQLDTQNKSLESATSRLDQKYEMLASQYALYNSIISKFQQSFASLQMQINNMSSK
ncbi:MAG: flagellar filament capping protein FliD [Campylobacteraceae bacterium]|nr:flagellar filament capping protein FliD [Campylobacteraceae bacterium]